MSVTFTSHMLQRLGAAAGAGSEVTDREARDGQLTVVRDERTVLLSVIPEASILRGRVAENRAAAEKDVVLFAGDRRIGLVKVPINFPKQDKPELRVYFNEDGFKPAAGDYWYVLRLLDGRLGIGSATYYQLDQIRRGAPATTLNVAEQGEVYVVARARAQVAARRGQAEFRSRVLAAFESTCCITRSATLAVLEAAHIATLPDADDNRIANALLLRADVHTLFDAGLLLVEPQTLFVRCHPDLRQSEYWRYDGKRIVGPQTTLEGIDRSALGVRWNERTWQ